MSANAFQYNISEREQYLEKPLPSAIEAEKIILANIILDNSALNEVSDILEPNDFYQPAHRHIYQAMLTLSARLEIIEPVIIIEELKKDGRDLTIGGLKTITDLIVGMYRTSELLDYCHIVKDKSLIRRGIKDLQLSISELLSEEDTFDNQIEVIENRIYALSDIKAQHQKKSFTKVGDIVHRRIHHVHEMQDRETIITGLPTGLTELDTKILGLQRQEFIIIAGRPSMGKTALGLTIGQNAALQSNALVAVFSLEMSEDGLGDRLLCSRACVDSHTYRSGFLNEEEWGRLMVAEQDLQPVEMYIDERPAINTDYMFKKLRRLVSDVRRPLDLILVDYLQLMTGTPGQRIENRQQEVTKICSTLKQMSKIFNCPLIAMSQLSRAPEGRNPPKPIMSDLRESGSIEQDADVVAFIYREEYYKPTVENENLAEVIISKNRNGPTGSVPLRFNKTTTTFQNLASEF